MGAAYFVAGSFPIENRNLHNNFEENSIESPIYNIEITQSENNSIKF